MNKIVLHNPSNEAPKPNNKTIKFVSVNPSPKGDKIYLKKEQKDDFVNHVVQSNPTQEKQDRQQHFWHETQTEKRIKNDPSTSECTPVRQMTCLQKRLLQASTRTAGPSFKELPSDWKAYFLLTAISEHEQDQGGGEDGGLEASMVGGSYWTTYEKNRFFVALDRCGRHCVHDIAKRVGPTKTIQEVAVYLNILDQLAKVSPKEQNAKLDPCAREMSPMFIMQEEQMASKLVKHLETESYKKHLELVSSKQYEYTEQLFDLRNMSSLTKL
jgi:hypothetical protein